MKITNLTSGAKRMGFLGNHGLILPHSGSLNVDDKHASHPSLHQMQRDGLVSLDNFSINDAPSADPFREGQGDYVSVVEFNESMKGLYVIPDGWAMADSPDATATPMILVGSDVGPFDTSALNFLKIKFDGLNTVLVELPKGQLDIATLVTTLNDDTEFAKYGVAVDDGGGKLKITSNALGVNSSIEFIDEARSAIAKVFMLVPAEITLPEGAVGTITFDTHNPVGNGLVGVEHTVTLYDASTGGSEVTTYQIQRVTKGEIISGINDTQAVIESGEDGEIEFEVAAPGTIANPCYVDVDVPSTHYFAQKPATRIIVTSE